MTNFKIGQRVICIKSHSKGYCKRGQYGTISNIDYNECCNKTILEFSDLRTRFKETQCQCGTKKSGDWFSASLFAPIQYTSATSEILEKFKLTEEKADVEIKELQTN